KKSLTSNLGLKVLSVLASVVLWLIVVNVDDPTITRTYAGIPVEIVNAGVITDEGKTYEVLDGTDSVSVVVTAKRSVIESMSRDYIRATADMKDLSFMNTVAIEVRSARYSDRIDAITPITKNLRVQIEEMQKKTLRIGVEVSGEPNSGFVTGNAKPSVNIVSVSGPVSVVSGLSYAMASVDVTGMSSNISTNSAIYLYDENDAQVTDKRLELSIKEVHVDVEILTAKVVPISCGHIAGSPADGFISSGIISFDPDSVRIAGSGNVINDISSIEIPSDVLSIQGATGSVTHEIDISRYLPNGIVIADPDFDKVVKVTLYVEKVNTADLVVPTGNITLSNVPEGYSAVIVDMSGTVNLRVSGLKAATDKADVNSIKGVIDASSMIPKEVQEGTISGIYDGEVVFTLPGNLTVSEPVYMQVILSPIGVSETVPEAAAGELPAETAGEVTEITEPVEGQQ
ncbi:MAG: hypothetical protein K5886_01945, partial [Lachnospiraceae bacterium]|nr:hypothetical protein [Lachnospiraceae bacterium]